MEISKHPQFTDTVFLQCPDLHPTGPPEAAGRRHLAGQIAADNHLVVFMMIICRREGKDIQKLACKGDAINNTAMPHKGCGEAVRIKLVSDADMKFGIFFNAGQDIFRISIKNILHDAVYIVFALPFDHLVLPFAERFQSLLKHFKLEKYDILNHKAVLQESKKKIPRKVVLFGVVVNVFLISAD